MGSIHLSLHRRTSSLHRCICIIRYTIILHSKLILLEILLGMRPNLDKSTCRYDGRYLPPILPKLLQTLEKQIVLLHRPPSDVVASFALLRIHGCIVCITFCARICTDSISGRSNVSIPALFWIIRSLLWNEGLGHFRCIIHSVTGINN